MENKNWCNLSWLQDAPSNFIERCERVTIDSSGELRQLATYKLNDNQLRKLVSICNKFSTPPSGFEPFKLGIIGNTNNDFLGPALKATALRFGLWLDIVIEPMGHTVISALNPESAICASDIDAVLLAYTHHTLFMPEPFTTKEEAEKQNLQLFNDITTIEDALKITNGASLIVQTIPEAPAALFGNIEQKITGALNYQIKRFNDQLISNKKYVMDIARLANVVGLSTWHNTGQWHWAKTPFSQNLIPLYADHIGRFIGSMRGRSKKCLVLDLDNTIWGGIIGDDGTEGIELGQGTPKGEAFIEIQKMALNLRKRGVVLAVCSKNDEQNALDPFYNHPEQILKKEHIAAFQANWNDKASNLEIIADTLSLSLDSFVFIDDNPAERDIVRRELPDVTVPEIPDNEPHLWPLIISAAGYFETTHFTNSDIDRAEQYCSNAKRNSLKSKTRDISDYLKALQMHMKIESFIPVNQARITQLINRSNQYNLTSRRYTEEQVKQMEESPSFICFSAHLKDKFGDNGIISVVICKNENTDWYIDTWLMSCRVLGRNVEKALLNHIAQTAKEQGKKYLIGHFIPSPKNNMVKEHYKNIGFKIELDKEETKWKLDLTDFQDFDVAIDNKKYTA